MIDQRAYNDKPIPVPEGSPLPYISRRALKRVRDPLDPPTSCDRCCGEHVRLVSNNEVYGRQFGDWPFLYLCDWCGAYVGLHPNTDIPLGTMADKETREARKRGKSAFFRMVKENDLSRDDGYKWLADELGIPSSECHWGWFDKFRCKEAERICLSRCF